MVRAYGFLARKTTVRVGRACARLQVRNEKRLERIARKVMHEEVEACLVELCHHLQVRPILAFTAWEEQDMGGNNVRDETKTGSKVVDIASVS